MDPIEQKCIYLLGRGRISKTECAEVLDVLTRRIADSDHWRAIAEQALSINNELRAEVARLSQIARY